MNISREWIVENKTILSIILLGLVILIFMVGRAYDQSTTVGLTKASDIAANYLGEDVVAIVHEGGIPRGGKLFEAAASKKKVLVFDDGTLLDVSALGEPSFFPPGSLDDRASAAVLSASGSPGDMTAGQYSTETEELRKQLRAKITQRLAPVMSHNSQTAKEYAGVESQGPETVLKAQPMTDVELDDSKVKTIYERVLASDEWMVSFKAINETSEIIVFTDWTCPYCQKLHNSIDQLNDAGITVHYLWMPRIFGLGEEDKRVQDVVSQMRNATCSSNPQKAMDLLFSGKKLTSGGCSAEKTAKIVSSIKEHYYLAFMLEIKGTPMIVTNQGKRFSGFSNAESLINAVREYSNPI